MTNRPADLLKMTVSNDPFYLKAGAEKVVGKL